MKQIALSLFRKIGILPVLENLRYVLIANRLAKKNQEFIKLNPDFKLPPQYLAYDAYSAPDWFFYKESGINAASFISNKIKEKLTTSETKNILEWGCGPSRIIRHLPSYLGNDFHIYGTDYNKETIKWCSEAINGVTFKVNDLIPPIPFDNHFFDFIYCFSVLTHLSEEMCQQWLADLKRVVRPGGFILLTTHGDHYYDSMLLKSERDIYKNKGVIIRKNVKEGSRTYVSFHSPDYMRDLFSSLNLKVVEFKPSGWFSYTFQDYWLVQSL